MQENSIYTITPPDMQLLEAGPSFTVLTTDQDFLRDVERIQEGLFKTVPINIYYPGGAVSSSNIAWTLSVMHLSDNVFVDLDTVNQLGLVTAITHDANKVFISQSSVNNDIVRLFNSLKEGYTVYNSLDDYMTMMLANFVSE